ncbi:MAG TPA: hypothetical protein DEQ77_00590 [Candidatus Omnitrophica bacterium]|nr:hypothetical protein [Candidatus Omnitrophota bacterium]
MKDTWIRRNDIPRALGISRQALIRAERYYPVDYRKRKGERGLWLTELPSSLVFTFRAAAKIVGLPYLAVLCASKKGFFNSYLSFTDSSGKRCPLRKLPYVSLQDAQFYANAQRVIAEVERLS